MTVTMKKKIFYKPFFNQIILKHASRFPNNKGYIIYIAANHHIKMISEGSCDTKA